MHKQGKIIAKVLKANPRTKRRKLITPSNLFAFDFTEAHVLFWLGSRQMVSQ